MINAKKYNEWRILFLTVLLCKAADFNNNWKEVDALNYILTFYDQKADDYDTAKMICDDIGATLVVLNDDFVLNVINNTIRDAANVDYFFVGAERNEPYCPIGPINFTLSINCVWHWVNGSLVDMMSLSWYENQPDNSGGLENRMIIRKSDSKVGDISHTYNLAGTICQKRKGYNVPWIFDTQKYRLTIYDTFSADWRGAIAICDGQSSDLVILVDEEVREAVYGIIRRAVNMEYFWIGAEGGGGDWKWIDGTPVDMNTIEWFDYSPDNDGCNNKMVIRKSDNKFGDVKENYKHGGTICQRKLACEDIISCGNGLCKDPDSEGYYECVCIQGYYGKICKDRYCDAYENPCHNGGSCISHTREEPFFTCNCTGLGYYGNSCDRELIKLNLENEAIGIVGGYANFNIEVTTFDGVLTIEAYKDTVDETPLQTKSDVTNETLIFTFVITSIQDGGNYIFIAHPKSREYSRTKNTSLIIHMNATITNISKSFIFSPVTNGSSEVKCEANGVPTPNVTWYNANGELVTNNNLGGVYQTIDAEIAVLHVDNAVLSDDGNYTCKTVNMVGSDSIFISDEEVLELAVYGSPTIISVKPTKCSSVGIISIEWQPNSQTSEVLHRFEVRSLNATISDNKTKLENTGAIVNFDGLQPYTEYNIFVEVCPDLCVAKLNLSETQTTGHGLPGIVRNAKVDQNEDWNVCIVYWEDPDTPVDQIVGYNIISEAKLVYISPDVGEVDTVNSESTLDSALHIQETKPNSEYKFFITARTCAGLGKNITATGSCITKYSSPAEVPDPVINRTADAGPTRQITISLASETNGPVSCSFVIVNRGNTIENNRTFTIQQLQDAENAAAARNTSVDYLAIAIPRENMTSNVYEANLGDETESSCDVARIFTGRNHRKQNTVSSSYRGKNLALATGGAKYGFYVVTSTPVEGEARLKRSETQKFTNGIAQPPSVVGAAVGGAVACLLFIVLFAAGICMWRRRNTPKELDEIYYTPTLTNEGNANPQFEEHTYEEVRQPYENLQIELPQ